MNRDIFSGKWKQIRGEIRSKWGKLTDDELDMINGQQDKLVGKLQEHYGWKREQAEMEVDRFMRDYDTKR